jgi:hypothetical protein
MERSICRSSPLFNKSYPLIQVDDDGSISLVIALAEQVRDNNIIIEI